MRTLKPTWKISEKLILENFAFLQSEFDFPKFNKKWIKDEYYISTQKDDIEFNSLIFKLSSDSPKIRIINHKQRTEFNEKLEITNHYHIDNLDKTGELKTVAKNGIDNIEIYIKKCADLLKENPKIWNGTKTVDNKQLNEIKKININEKYFLASFKSNNNKPEDFGLKKVKGTENFIDKNGNLWQNEILWDSGWGNEYGFVKQPEPDFDQLWILLTESNIENNQLGSSELLTHYPNELKEKLQELFKRDEKLNRDLTKRLSNLDILNHVMNHSEMKGKRPEEVDADYREWKKLKEDFDKLKTESLINRIKKTVANKG